MTSTKEMELLEHHKYKGIIGLNNKVRDEEARPNFKAADEYFPKLSHKKV